MSGHITRRVGRACALLSLASSCGHRGAATFLLLFQWDRFPRRRRAGAVPCAHNAHATMSKQRDAIGAVSDSKLATGDPQQWKRPSDLETTSCRVEVDSAPASCCVLCFLMYKQALCAMAHLLPQPHAQAVNSLGCTTTSFSHHEIARPTRISSFQKNPLHGGLDYTVKNIKHNEKQAQRRLLRAREPSQGQTVGSAAGGLPCSIQCR